MDLDAEIIYDICTHINYVKTNFQIVLKKYRAMRIRVIRNNGLVQKEE